MDVLLLILGFLTAIASIVLSVIAIINGTSKTITLLLLAVAFLLIKIGRELNKKKPK